MMSAMSVAAFAGIGVLATARVATWVLGSASASLRHLIWTTALAALVAVPMLEASGLQFEVPLCQAP